MKPTPRPSSPRLLTTLLPTLLLGALLASAPGGGSAAQSAAQLLDPTVNLPSLMGLTAEPEGDVVRLRPAAPSLKIVTRGTTTPKYVARKYGVTLGAVKTVEKHKGLRVVQVRLPGERLSRAPLRPASVVTYQVRPGDTLAGVAARFGLDVVDVLGVNLNRRSLDRLSAGEHLNLPTRERGLLVRIKPGQSAMSLIAGYKADLVAVARANDVLPTELQVGDELLLPGIRAQNFEQQLLARREAERLAAIAYAKQQKYERFLAWKKEQVRQRLEAKYRTQEQYEAYLAWMASPERQRQIAAYERQERFEREQAAARARARQAAQEAQAAARARAAVRAASVSQQATPPAVGAVSVVRRVSSSGGLSWPMRSFRLSSGFGSRDIAVHRAMFHGGIDLAAAYGTPIYAASSGVVSQSGWGYYGLNVLVQDGNRTLVYGHMSRTAVYAGQSVGRGQLIGYVGCTGICTGPHLHFEVRLGGRAVNPLALLP